MNLRKKIRRNLAEFLELPLDVSLDVPRIVILGDLGVIISNHRGLIQYSIERIVVGVGKGQITIDGENLAVEEVSKEDMAVKGLIKKVEMNA